MIMAHGIEEREIMYSDVEKDLGKDFEVIKNIFNVIAERFNSSL